MNSDYKPPTRFSRLLRSGGLFWGGLAAVAIVVGLYAIGHI
jgi:hypothetical protein